MTKPRPLMADDKTAAHLMCLTRPEFLRLVAAGHLPAGREIAPGIVRWPVTDLESIARGTAARPKRAFEL